VFLPSSTVSPTSSSPVTVTLTVTAGAGTLVGGPVAVTLSAMTAGAPAAKTQTFSLTVTGVTPDFKIAVTATPNGTVVNQNVTWNGTLTAINGYSGKVALSCTTGAPATCMTPAAVTPTAGGAPFAVALGSATAGTFNFTIQGTDGTLTHATPMETLTVGTDVKWTDTGNAAATVLAGQSASYTFSAATLGGTAFSSAVNFGCAGLPALASCGFSPASIAAGAGTTAVTLTITTTGPNFGAELRPRVGTVPRTVWFGKGTPYAAIWLLLAGVVGLGRKRRGTPRLYRGLVGIFLGLGLMAEISCGGVAGAGGTTPPPVTVTVNPGLATLFTDEVGNSWPPGVTQQQFSATVNGSTNQSVTWAVTGAGTNGTVDGNGLYTAPAVMPNPATVTVTATPAAAGSQGSAFVTVAAATPVGTSSITVTATAAGGTAHGDVVTLTVQ